MTKTKMPEGKALQLDIETGLTSPEQIAELLREATNLPEVDDLDRVAILQAASAVAVMPQVMEQAVTLLNAVSRAHGEDTRISTTGLFMGLTMTMPSLVDVDENGEPVEDV